MEASASFVCSKVTPFSSTLYPNNYLISFSPFNKQLRLKTRSTKTSLVRSSLNPNSTSPNCSLSFEHIRNLEPFRSQPGFSAFSPDPSRTTRPVLKCSYSTPISSNESNWPSPLLRSLKGLSFDSLKSAISKLTPVVVCKWGLILSIVIVASKKTTNVLLSPFFWMYVSMTWLFWPWMVAIVLGIYGLYSLNKHLKGESNLFEQLAIVTSAFTWLTLVPPAHFNGFLEGWPFVFFFVYHYFFFLSVSVRNRLYGDYYPRKHENKWDVSLPNLQKLLFSVGVMVGHWLAAFEGTELHLIPGGWNNVGIWVLIISTVFMQYNSTLYLAKYSEKVVVPTAVVQFGPYRFVRHPIYASTMLLFVTYFAALRAPMSSVFVIAVCLLYYGRKAKLEEDLMLENFEESYREYMSKVRYKLIPFVY